MSWLMVAILAMTLRDQVKLILNAKTTVAKRNELHMFTVLPQRWIVERSWSWLTNVGDFGKPVNAPLTAVFKWLYWPS